jgi:hypothetical protein
VKPALRSLFERLRTSGPFLGDPSICRRIFQGLKTSSDAVYVLDLVGVEGKDTRAHSEALDAEVVLESDLLKPIVKGHEMKRFAPLRPRKAVIFPYSVGGEAALLTAREMEERWPKTWHYLLANRKTLEARERGRFRGAAWYQFGRSQALDVVGLPKVLTADLADRMAFSVDSDGKYYFLGGAGGGYGLIPTRPEHAFPLTAVLNSRLLEWLLRPPGLSTPQRGGWFLCEARFINLLPIRLPENEADVWILGGLSERARQLYEKASLTRSTRDRALVARQIESVEGEIDDRVFSMYGLTKDERNAVNEEVSAARSASAHPGEDEE